MPSNAWGEMPWQGFMDPAEQWSRMPSFLVVEYAMLLQAAVGLVHAWRTGRLTLWCASVLCGTANDVFFMVLPVGGEFWQAQATIMLTPRLPLYIVALCGYFGRGSGRGVVEFSRVK